MSDFATLSDAFGSSEFWQIIALSLSVSLSATAAATLLGLPFGTVLAIWLKGDALTLVFAVIALLVAVNMGFTGVDFRLRETLPGGVLRQAIGTFIGTTAAIVPLSIVAIPFFARMVEIALKEIDPGLTEAAESLGATRAQIVWKVFIPGS